MHLSHLLFENVTALFNSPTVNLADAVALFCNGAVILGKHNAHLAVVDYNVSGIIKSHIEVVVKDRLKYKRHMTYASAARGLLSLSFALLSGKCFVFFHLARPLNNK